MGVIVTLAELDLAYAAALQDAGKESDWYKSRRWIWIILSWGTRILAATALALGVILPLSKASVPCFESAAQAAVASIAFAGLMIGADRVFMISSTWTRYVNAMMKIETLRKGAEFDWIALKTGLADPVSTQDIQKAIALFKALVIDSRKIVETETSSWSEELIKAVEQLRAMIGEQKAAAETLVREERNAREAAQKLASVPTHGAIRVKIEGAFERLAGPIKVTAAGRSQDRDASTTTVIVPDVASGIHTVRLEGQDAQGKSVVVENVVQVKPNTIVEVPLLIR